MKNYLIKINQFIEQQFLNYINVATKAFYPKNQRIESQYRDEQDDEDPILFI